MQCTLMAAVPESNSARQDWTDHPSVRDVLLAPVLMCWSSKMPKVLVINVMACDEIVQTAM